VTPAGRVFSRARDLAAITFPAGRVVQCWHTDGQALRGDAWQAVWSQATQLPQT
jgi:hypothetical protein